MFVMVEGDLSRGEVERQTCVPSDLVANTGGRFVHASARTARPKYISTYYSTFPKLPGATTGRYYSDQVLCSRCPGALVAPLPGYRRRGSDGHSQTPESRCRLRPRVISFRLTPGERPRRVRMVTQREQLRLEGSCQHPV